jgi:hypothetical protein
MVILIIIILSMILSSTLMIFNYHMIMKLIKFRKDKITKSENFRIRYNAIYKPTTISINNEIDEDLLF